MAADESGAERFSTRAAARILAVSPARIRQWVRGRLIEPEVASGGGYRFAFSDLLAMRTARELLAGRRHLKPLQRCLSRIRAHLGPARDLGTLKLANQDGTLVVRAGGALFEAESGQLLFDFERGPEAGGRVEKNFASRRTLERLREADAAAQGDPGRAFRLLDDLLEREPQNFDAHMRAASLREAVGDLTAALRHLLAALATRPADAGVHFRLGLIYRRRAEHNNAVAAFVRALECDPALAEAHRNLAELYESAGRETDAIRHLSALHRLIRDQ